MRHLQNLVKTYMITIQSSFDSTSGLIKLMAVPLTHIECIAADETGAFANVYIKSERQIVDIPIEMPEQFDWQEEMKETDGGDTYHEKIVGGIRCEDEKNRNIIRTLEVGRWIVLFEDTLGTIRVVGSQEFPMRFITSRNFSKSNGTTFTMECVQLTPAPIVKNMDEL